MLKHAFTSLAAASGDSAQVDGPKWNADHVVDENGINMLANTGAPATPAAGSLALYARNVGGRMMPGARDPSGLNWVQQPFFGRNKIGMWMPLGNNSAAPFTSFGIIAPTFTGTATQRNVATISLFASLRRVGAVSAATAGNYARVTNGAAQFWRGNVAGAGGFHAVFRFGCSDAAVVAGARTFVGMASAGVANVDPSLQANLIGVGSDGGDANLSMMANDGSGSATKIPLGVNFPDHTLSGDVYELTLYAPPNGSFVSWEVWRINTGDVARGVFESDLPAATTMLMPQFVRSNNTTALAVGIDVMNFYIETDN